ncbi:MAG: hypothetical protein ACR2K5_05730 [Pseudolabrys sp.]
MTLMKTIVASIMILTAPAALAAGSSQGYGNGGQFVRFDPVVAQYNASGELFRIQGHCQSACTLFLAIRNVCVERSAQLLFHAGHDRQRNITASATQHMVSAYNGRLRQYLTAGGYMNTMAFHTLPGSALIDRFGYKECPKR